MSQFQIQIHSIKREEGEPWLDALPMVSLVRDAVARGAAPLAAVVLRGDRVDIVDLKNVVAAGLPLQNFIAGLSRSTTDDAGAVEAVGLMGIVKVRRSRSEDERPMPMAVAFLEWEDCRWWSWRGLLDAEQSDILHTSEVVSCAEEGDALPHRFGRWWSLGRRRNMRLHLSRKGRESEDSSIELLN